MILRFGKLLPWLLLLAMGTGWGLAFSLAKMGILAGGKPLGMAFWQMVVAIILTLVVARLQGRPVPMDRPHIRNYLIVSALATLYGCAIAPRMPHIPNQAALWSCLPQISARQTTNNWRLDQLAGVGLRGETSDNPMIMTVSDVQTHPEWLSANSTIPQITPAIVTRYPVWLAKIAPAR